MTATRLPQCGDRVRRAGRPKIEGFVVNILAHGTYVYGVDWDRAGRTPAYHSADEIEVIA